MTNNQNIINLPSQTELSGFYVVFNGSTNLESDKLRGISHLSEHMLCKHLDHLMDAYERDSIQWNAYTSHNNIVFYLTGLDEKVNQYKNEFLNLLTEFNLTKDQFDDEKRIVLEEYYDAFNSQTENHMLNLDRKLFNSYDPIGSKEALTNMTFKDFIEFFELQYSQPSKIINVSKNNPFVGDVEFNPIVIDKQYSFLKDNPYTREISNDFADKTSIIMYSPFINENNAYVHIINEILGGGLKSPFYQEVREKLGLVYYINCYQSRFNNQGLNTIATLTSNKNVDKVIDTIKKVMNDKKQFLTKERFDIVTESLKIRFKMADINRYKSINRYIDPEGFDVEKIINIVKFDDLYDMYDKYYNINDYYISTDKTEFK
jgi:predicted Zn-dependent peptidase